MEREREREREKEGKRRELQGKYVEIERDKEKLMKREEKKERRKPDIHNYMKQKIVMGNKQERYIHTDGSARTKLSVEKALRPINNN